MDIVQHEKSISSCMESLHEYRVRDLDSQQKICDAKAEETMKDVGIGRNWKLFWQRAHWHLVWAVPATLVIPPLIVYGLVWLVVKTGLWVAAGFRQGNS